MKTYSVKLRRNASGQEYKVLLEDNCVIGSYSAQVKDSIILACFENNQKRANPHQVTRPLTLSQKLRTSEYKPQNYEVKSVKAFGWRGGGNA